MSDHDIFILLLYFIVVKFHCRLHLFLFVVVKIRTVTEFVS